MLCGEANFNSMPVLSLQMDIAGALSPEECMEELELDRIRDKPWHIAYVFAKLIFYC